MESVTINEVLFSAIGVIGTALGGYFTYKNKQLDAELTKKKEETTEKDNAIGQVLETIESNDKNIKEFMEIVSFNEPDTKFTVTVPVYTRTPIYCKDDRNAITAEETKNKGLTAITSDEARVMQNLIINLAMVGKSYTVSSDIGNMGDYNQVHIGSPIANDYTYRRMRDFNLIGDTNPKFKHYIGADGVCNSPNRDKKREIIHDCVQITGICVTVDDCDKEKTIVVRKLKSVNMNETDTILKEYEPNDDWNDIILNKGELLEITGEANVDVYANRCSNKYFKAFRKIRKVISPIQHEERDRGNGKNYRVQDGETLIIESCTNREWGFKCEGHELFKCATPDIEPAILIKGRFGGKVVHLLFGSSCEGSIKAAEMLMKPNNFQVRCENKTFTLYDKLKNRDRYFVVIEITRIKVNNDIRYEYTMRDCTGLM